jgi:hypothetical protein
MDTPTKLVEEQQTAADALWGYRDGHGKWTAGLTQRVTAIEAKQNLSIGLIAAALAKLLGPDVASLLVNAAKASGLH